MIKMTKTTIRLNDDEWDIVLEALESFSEIEVVSVKASAGYLLGYDDPEFIEQLEKIIKGF